ncbi:MAG TPA: DJ-1/PfpI family protein [Candidatus Deferrimicrobium sp.]|nr:DJ-1/PfpI family protein [Candidatus Deferrimicrobium sp.]
MGLTGKRVAFLLETHYDNLDFAHVIRKLNESGVINTIFGPNLATIFGKGGRHAIADKVFNDLDVNDFDGVIIPGGDSPFQLRKNQKVLTFIAEMHKHGKLIGAIGTAPIVLLAAGILTDISVTAIPRILEELEAAKVKIDPQGVVIDKNIITCKTDAHLMGFTKMVLTQLE